MSFDTISSPSSTKSALEPPAVDEAADLLAVSPATIRDIARKAEIPGRKVGKQWRFVRSAVLAWVSGDEPHRHAPTA